MLGAPIAIDKGGPLAFLAHDLRRVTMIKTSWPFACSPALD